MNNMNDPLLGNTPYFNDDAQMRIEQLRMRQMELSNQLNSMSNPGQQAPVQQPQRTPIWDEIDMIVSNLSNQEVNYMGKNSDYVQSNNEIQRLMLTAQIRFFRPMIEGSEEGRKILQNHLDLVKRLRKEAANEVSRRNELLDDYIENHSDIPFKDYLQSLKK